MGWWLLHEAKRISRQLNLLLSLASIVIIGLISLDQPWIHFQVPLAPLGDPGFRTIPIDTVFVVRCSDMACLHEYDQNACKACPIPGAPLSSLFQRHRPVFLPPLGGSSLFLGGSSLPQNHPHCPLLILTYMIPILTVLTTLASYTLFLRNLSTSRQVGSSILTPLITAQEPVLTDLEVHTSMRKASICLSLPSLEPSFNFLTMLE